ncbi:SAM-dependent methyltransferase [Micromonospora sp. NPDC050397]|uniref:SAM-dependent methyltransferase n=1 Tax=Micromonospora sp. NPDC050397 TaxID=3364279 RepID=UPI00384BF906
MPPIDDLAAARYARMRWNTPLSEEHAALLLRRLGLRPGVHVLDLGCGWGELLLRAVATDDTGRTTGVGVDTDAAALARGRDLAERRLLDGRVSFVEQEAGTWREPGDRVLCLGAAHALGGTAAALDRLTELVRPGGRLLFGDAFWERPPGPAAVEIFGDELSNLSGLVERIRGAGWRVLHFSTTDQREWDDFESTWLAGRQEWLLANPGDPRAPEVREQLDDRLRQYVDVYRGVLGLGYFVLARSAG